MDFKSLLSQLTQLNEATDRSEPGKVKHTAEPGGYGRKDDEDEEGKQVKPVSTEKRGKGRPKKATQTSGEDKKYDFSAFGASGKDVKLPKWDKKKTTKHSLKEWFDEIDKKYVAEAGAPGQQLQIKPMPGASQLQDPASGKIVATGPADKIKAMQDSIAKGEVTMPGKQEMSEEDIGKHNNATTGFDAMVRKLTPKYGVEAAKRIAGAQLKKIKEAEQPSDQMDMGAGLGAGRSQATFESRAKADNKAEKAGKKVTKDLEYDMKHKGKDDAKAERAGKKVTKDIEYDEKKKKTVKEEAKPDFPDIDDDGNKKETISKAAQDAKKKKKVKEGMDQKLHAARSEGKAHGLRGHSHCGKNYEDMEEARCYHEGYKEGLDECYGQQPVLGLVGEVEGTGPAATVPGMASQYMHGGVEEGNAFTRALARTPAGDKFSVGGKTFTDNSGYDAKLDEFAFESLDKQLNALLEGKKEVAEGMTVSISKGQQGSPDSVSVTAQDSEADQLLQVIKQAGLGLFGGNDAGQVGQSSPMSLQPADGGAEGGMEIDVVDDHDGMMNLIKKVVGGEQHSGPEQGFGDAEQSSSDYEDEEGHEHDGEEECGTCGAAPCDCDSKEGEEQVDEVESEDQMEYEVAEDNAPDSGAAETTADENAEAAEDEALAKADELNEWANEAGKNGTETTFEQDIDFMTKVISGGLNKQKSTGQTTIPVVSTQINRLGSPMQESINLLTDWKKLSGIK
jgi:hypothetical protein